MKTCEVCGRSRKEEYMRAVPGAWRCRARATCKMKRKDARNRARKQERLEREGKDQK